MNLFSFFIVAMIVMCLFALVGTIFGETDSSKNEVGKSKIGKKGTTFNIISSQENEDLENVVKDYAKSKGYKGGMATAGVVCGIIGIVLMVLMWIGLSALVSQFM